MTDAHLMIDVILLVALVFLGVLFVVMFWQEWKWKRQFDELRRRDRDERKSRWTR